MELKWKENLIDITPYVPGEQSEVPGIVKLNANENPYPPSPMAVKALQQFDASKLRLYPDATGKQLKQALAKRSGVGSDNVFLGNGSDDVLAVCFQAFFHSNKPIVYPDITYSFYPVWCQLFQVPYTVLPLNADFRICPRDYDAPNGGVLLPNPNAPTGIGEGRAVLVDILEHNTDCVVIVDEAYVDFSDYSAIELTKQYENLLVVATFSKSRSLAGLRVGYAIGSTTLIGTLEAVKNAYNSYTVDSVSFAVATASAHDEAYFAGTVAKVKHTRGYVTHALRQMGFDVLDSSANFILMTSETIRAKALFEFLKEQKIFVRYFPLPRIDNYLRVTIGTDVQMEQFLSAVASFCALKK